MLFSLLAGMSAAQDPVAEARDRAAKALYLLAGAAEAQGQDPVTNARGRAAGAMAQIESIAARANTVTMRIEALDGAREELDPWRESQEDGLRTSSDVDDLRERLSEKRDERWDEREKKDREIDDLRKCRYCKACHKTKTQIEEIGRETWQQHLDKNSGGVPEPASPKAIASLAAEYDARIATLDGEIESLESRIDMLEEQIREAQRALDEEYDRRAAEIRRGMSNLAIERTALGSEMTKQIAIWLEGLQDENRLLSDRIRAGLKAADEATASLERAIRRAEHASAYAHDKGFTSTELEQRALESELLRCRLMVQDQLERFVFSARQSIAEWDERRTAQADTVQAAFEKNDLGLPFLKVNCDWPSDWPTFPGKVPDWVSSFSPSPLEAGPCRVKVTLGVGNYLGVSFEVEHDPVLLTQRLRIMLEGPGGVGVGMERRTPRTGYQTDHPVVIPFPDGVVLPEATPGRRDLERVLERKGTPPDKKNTDLRRRLEGNR